MWAAVSLMAEDRTPARKINFVPPRHSQLSASEPYPPTMSVTGIGFLPHRCGQSPVRCPAVIEDDGH